VERDPKNKLNVYKVEIREYERGWGQKTDCIKSFASKREALEFTEAYNSKNTCKTVPDWYMVAIPMFNDLSPEPEKKKTNTKHEKETDNILDF